MTETAPTQELFLEQWQVYRKMVDNDYLFHRAAYDCLHRHLRDEVTGPFRFLEAACGDAGMSTEALLGTKVSAYHGIDISKQALEIAERNLARLALSGDIGRARLRQRPARLAASRRCRLDRVVAASSAWPRRRLKHCAISGVSSERMDACSSMRMQVPTARAGTSGSRAGMHRNQHWTAYSRREWMMVNDHVHCVGFSGDRFDLACLGKERWICARDDALRIADQSASALPLPSVAFELRRRGRCQKMLFPRAPGRSCSVSAN